MLYAINDLYAALPPEISRCWLYALLAPAHVTTEIRGNGLTNLYCPILTRAAVAERKKHLKNSNSPRKTWNYNKSKVRLDAVLSAVKKVEKCK